MFLVKSFSNNPSHLVNFGRLKSAKVTGCERRIRESEVYDALKQAGSKKILGLDGLL